MMDWINIGLGLAMCIGLFYGFGLAMVSLDAAVPVAMPCTAQATDSQSQETNR